MVSTSVPGGFSAGSGDDLAPLLLALQLTDSSFPSGLYTLSHGLEGLAQRGEVDAARVGPVLHGLLRHSIGPGDATALALAWRAAAFATGVEDDDGTVLDRLAEIDRRVHATRLSREIRAAATRTGRQVLDLAAELLDDRLVHAWNARVRGRRAPGSLPVVTGLVYARGGLSARAAVAADLSAFCTSYAGAALRLRLVDHRSAQVLVREAAPVVAEVADAALDRPLEALGGFAPRIDVASASHERAAARLFGS